MMLRKPPLYPTILVFENSLHLGEYDLVVLQG